MPTLMECFRNFSAQRRTSLKGYKGNISCFAKVFKGTRGSITIKLYSFCRYNATSFIHSTGQHHSYSSAI
uniref:Uncharacterized protein n=1 Tax=Arundo donax TaxID=35708 RepID=A0A0A9DPH8_ARUDO